MSDDLRMVREDLFEYRAKLMEEMQNKRLQEFQGDPADFWKNWREDAVRKMIEEYRALSGTYKG